MLSADDQIHGQHPNQEQHQLSNSKPSYAGVRRPEDGKHGESAEQSERELDRQKVDVGAVAEQVDRVQHGGGGEQRLRGSDGNLQRQDKQAKEDRSPTGNRRSRQFTTRPFEDFPQVVTQALRLYWIQGRNSRCIGRLQGEAVQPLWRDVTNR